MYEGRVPLHHRLVLLCQDFLESIFDFNISDIFNLQKQAKNGTVFSMDVETKVNTNDSTTSTAE